MTLTELRYVVAVARERHFGRAADACFVSQPTLSVSIKKLEEELGTPIFERRTNDVTMTAAGELIVGQAQRTLDEAGRVKEIARRGRAKTRCQDRCGSVSSTRSAPICCPRWCVNCSKTRRRCRCC